MPPTLPFPASDPLYTIQADRRAKGLPHHIHTPFCSQWKEGDALFVVKEGCRLQNERREEDVKGVDGKGQEKGKGKGNEKVGLGIMNAGVL